MTPVIALLILLVLLGWTLVRLARTIHRDGLGERRPPASHYDWTDQP